MQIINEARKDINKIWGRQSVKDTQYRPLKYLLEVPVDEGLLVHNVVSGELVLLEGDEIAQYKAGQHADLIAKHFLVPQDFDEHASVMNLRKILRLLDNDKSITGYTILPTTYCNARCFYCYEAGMEHIHMTDETADQVVEFIEKNHGGHPIRIEWFGGEPLIGSKTISRICQSLRDKNIKYKSSMTSNGYLFDEELIQTARNDWNLKSIQITLDGTEEVYNKVKDYQGVKDNPYQRVLRNIELLLNAEIEVVVRMNLDYHNYDNLEDLVDELREHFSKYGHFNSYVHTIFENEGFDKVSHTEEERKAIISREATLNQSLIEAAVKNDIIELPALKTHSCMADRGKSIVVYPNGSLAKCEHCPNENLGNVWEGLIDIKRCDEWKEIVIFPECDICNLFPMCVRLKKCFDSIFCTKQFRSSVINKIMSADRDLLNKHNK